METIGEYEYSKKDLIGHGAFAVVFKGHVKKKPSSVVAIKCITKKNLAKSAALLSKEIRILKELSGLHHENVVGLMDCKETPHHVFLVMEYCNGGDLADYLHVKGTLSEDTIAAFLKHIAAALKALNSKGVVHRDLKPQNILLCHSARPNPPASEITLKIADFGFARFLQDGVMAATLCGSPMYMAPEVIMSLQYDAKADLWSIGTIVYQCLTGKAPFQAQTPQQLKQFYERNANLAPNVPAGTSPDLKDLLMRLLKRSAKDRIPFDAFFLHPFFNPRLTPRAAAQKSSPVPVPRTRSKSSISSDSPRMQAISASPLSGATAPSPPLGGLAVSPPHTVRLRTRRGSQASEPMDTGSGSNQGDSSTSGDVTMTTEQEGFVLVPENIPSDQSGASPKVDLNAIFSDESPDNPRLPHHRAPGHSPGRGGNPSPGARGTSPSEEQQAGSPSRPSSFPVEIPVSHRPSSEPIPVPTQRKNYELIQRSIGQSPSPGGHSADPPISPRKGSSGSTSTSSGPRGVSPHQPLSSKGSSSSLASSPPGVQFCVGTPPTTHYHHQAGGLNARAGSVPAQYGASPGRQTVDSTPPRAATYSTFQNAQTLATIRGSPTRPGDRFPPTQEEFTSPNVAREESTFGPLRRTRTHTCPDNMATYHMDTANNSLVPIGQGQAPSFTVENRQSGSGGRRLSEQLIRAAFGAQLPSPPTTGLAAQLTNQSPPQLSSLLVNYGVSSSPLQRTPSNTSLSRVRRISTTDPDSPPVTIAESSPNMEGPVSFVAPDLAEDTLLDSVHKDTVNKINFVLALVECIIEIANMKSSVLSDSMVMTAVAMDDRANDNPDQNRLEELLLMVRALQLLGATIQLAKEEVQAKRLQPSATVKTILTEMTGHYHKCLVRCKELHKMGVTDNANMSASVMANTADKIIYTYAIDMCQTAALDELFGNPKECFHHYRNAHILLHSLAEKAQDVKDKELLSRYRESVEKRIMALHSAGLIDCIQPTKPVSTST